MDLSKNIGDYMLQGWILTDDVCPALGCKYPLMRSPAARLPPETFCPSCEGGPVGSQARKTPTRSIVPQVSEAATAQTESASSSSHRSRASTPPTDISEPRDNADDEFETLPPPTEGALQRRAQSDYASTEIAKLLLRGYALLAEECPNPTCYGVPLVRPPKASDGALSPNKECVVCQSVFTFGSDGRSLVPVAIPTTSIPTMMRPNAQTPAQTFSPAVPSALKTPVKRSKPSHTSRVTYGSAESTMPHITHNAPPPQVSGALQQTVIALEQSLTTLASRLHDLSSPASSAQGGLNTTAITEVARTMESVLDALNKAKQIS